MISFLIRHKVITLLSFIVLLVAIVVFFNNKENNMSEEIRIDKKPITERFPNLGDFIKCYWTAGVSSKDSRLSPPGPTSYKLRGFVVLGEKEADDFKRRFTWRNVPSDWKPVLDTNLLEVSNLTWVYSNDFNDYIKKPSFIGNFYFEQEHGVVYFDVTK